MLTRCARASRSSEPCGTQPPSRRPTPSTDPVDRSASAIRAKVPRRRRELLRKLELTQPRPASFLSRPTCLARRVFVARASRSASRPFRLERFAEAWNAVEWTALENPRERIFG